MASKELRALIVLAGKVDPSLQNSMLKAVGHTKKLESAAKSTGSSFTGMAKNAALTALAYVGFRSAKQFITDAMTASMENEKALAQLGAVIKSTGGASGMTAASVMDLTDSLNLNTTFSKASILQGENLLLTFTKIGKDVFPAASKAALNMSTALGQDTKSSAIQLGKALNDPITGMTALRRVGVSFTESQKKQITALQKSGDLLGAQKLILAELNTEFGGSAAAQAATMAGRIAIAEKQFKSFRTKVGVALLPVAEDLLNIGIKAMPYVTTGITKGVEVVKQFAAVLRSDVIPLASEVAIKMGNAFNSPIIQAGIKWIGKLAVYEFKRTGNQIKWACDHVDILASATAGLLTVMAGFKALALYNSLMKAWEASTIAVAWAQGGLNAVMAANPVGLVIVGIGLLVAAGIYLWQNWDMVAGKFHTVWVGIKNTFTEGINYVIDRTNDLIAGLNNIPGVNINLIPRVAYESALAGQGNFKQLYQGYANGGIASQPSIFGEGRVSEIAIPLERKPRSLGLLNQANRMLGGGGSGEKNDINLTVHVHACEW